MQIDLDSDGAVLTVLSGRPVPIDDGGRTIEVAVGEPRRFARVEFAAAAPADEPPSGEGEAGATTADAASA